MRKPNVIVLIGILVIVTNVNMIVSNAADPVQQKRDQANFIFKEEKMCRIIM